MMRPKEMAGRPDRRVRRVPIVLQMARERLPNDNRPRADDQNMRLFFHSAAITSCVSECKDPSPPRRPEDRAGSQHDTLYKDKANIETGGNRPDHSGPGGMHRRRKTGRSDRDASSSASRPALADASRSQIPAVKKTLSEARSQLPQLTRAESKRDANGVAPAEAHRPAIVRSKPKLPERTRQTAIAVEHTRLEDTSKDLPETSPTGPISAPKQVEPGSRTLA